MTPKKPRLRRGLTLHERQQLRGMVYQIEAARAVARAQAWGLSPDCRAGLHESLQGDPAKAAVLHSGCKAEEIDGKGCLCQCHDLVPTGVVSRTMHQVLYD